MSMLKIFVGTMYGGALDVAEQVKPLFEEAGFDVEILEQPELADLTEPMPELALFCVSTTGSGDYPGNFVPFARAIEELGPDLGALRYGLIALGDSSYGDTFCGSGRALDTLLREYGATRLGERLEVDAMETFMADDAAIPWVEEWIESQQLKGDKT
ncbi:nitric oxide synthase [Pistricoccus aurantiacus]|uniref:Nitric oxide synthase n=1 Tax=Pistricoccus aurantiacus TaxID=1883414 RepID=A0A5B8SYL2_9GAMM|nr:flavodoxin domain-containing protein [Pistricoccus aurantiacus]QEA39903.1 nitric oxide synthase [Pistricoccus aurantiacus]